MQKVDLEMLARPEVRETAIAFAKYLMSQDVVRQEFAGKSEEYNPKEFALVLGNLIMDGDQMYQDFVLDTFKVNSIYKLKR